MGKLPVKLFVTAAAVTAAYGLGAAAVRYLDANGKEQTCADGIAVTEGTGEFGDGRWYYVPAGVSISRAGIQVSGSAHLILGDGGSLSCAVGSQMRAAVDVSKGSELTIYCQSGGTGRLEAIGGEGGAGIGGGRHCDGGTVTVNGGRVTATGGEGGAGIGGGYEGRGGAVTVNGGTVTATGGCYGDGIGAGREGGYGTVTVNGGTVTATGGGEGGRGIAAYDDRMHVSAGAVVRSGAIAPTDRLAVDSGGEVSLDTVRYYYVKGPDLTGKVLVEGGGSTLRFVCTGQTPAGQKDSDWFLVAEAETINPQSEQPRWYAKRGTVTRVVFDSSFADYRPSQCGSWFSYFSELTAVEGLENLDVSEVDLFKFMFNKCSSLRTLDLFTFDTRSVTDMTGMFAGCSSLKTVLVGDGRFVLPYVNGVKSCADPTWLTGNMFDSCYSLVGGAGTEFDTGRSNYKDGTCAWIDGKDGKPGYFTAAPAYRVRFDANGGSGTMADMLCRVGKVYNLTANGFNGGAGNRFLGWNDAAKRTRYDDRMLVFDLADAGETVTLAAVWKLGGVQLWEGGPCWAECNVGAARPEEDGCYFWWGDTVGYSREGGVRDEYGTYRNLTWVSSKGAGMGGSPFGKSTCPTGGKSASELRTAGYIDSSGNLMAEYDAATAQLGAPWRMPTDAEWNALLVNCDCRPTTRSGVFGLLVTGKGDYSSKSIFLPAAGHGSDLELWGSGECGYYWTSSRDPEDSFSVMYLDFGSEHHYTYISDPGYGQSVRPVRSAAK